MTIICAYESKDRYWIGSDSYAIADSCRMDRGSKLIEKGDYILGFSGSFRIADIIREDNAYPLQIRDEYDLMAFRDQLRAKIGEDELVGLGSEELGSHPIDLIFVSPSGIYGLSSDYQIFKSKIGYLAIGAGVSFGMGALCALKKIKYDDGEKAIKMAIGAAISHSGACGGSCYVSAVPKNKRRN